MKYIDGGVCAPLGFKANGLQVGIGSKPGVSSKPAKIKNDVGIIYSEVKAAAAAVYTQNKVKGAPITVTRKNIAGGYAQAVIVNSKNANTCNADGEEKAQGMCQATARALGIAATDMIVASTGVIGQPLDITPIVANMEKLVAGLSRNGSDACATAIMTTDLKKKEVAVEFDVDGKICRLGGIAKGSGMIHPNMATMLCFITTDIAIVPELLQVALSEVTQDTFNMVSVDGDTSTNDMACVLANGLAGNGIITEKTEAYNQFKSALYTVMRDLSKAIARDGEGATKLLECVCSGAADVETAKIVAKSVITSSLFKAAMFGEDANWGRVLCAIGYAPAEFDINKVEVVLASPGGRVVVCENGSGVPFSEAEAKQVLAEEEIKILVELHSGTATATAWGCDLTYDYVKINGSYRS